MGIVKWVKGKIRDWKLYYFIKFGGEHFRYITVKTNKENDAVEAMLFSVCTENAIVDSSKKTKKASKK